MKSTKKMELEIITLGFYSTNCLQKKILILIRHIDDF